MVHGAVYGLTPLITSGYVFPGRVFLAPKLVLRRLSKSWSSPPCWGFIIGPSNPKGKMFTVIPPLELFSTLARCASLLLPYL